MACLLVRDELIVDLKFTSWECLRSTPDFGTKYNDITVTDGHGCLAGQLSTVEVRSMHGANVLNCDNLRLVSF